MVHYFICINTALLPGRPHLFLRRTAIHTIRNILNPFIILCSSPRRPRVSSPIVSPVLEEMVRHHRSMRTHPLRLLVVRRSRHQSSHLFWRRWSVIIDPCIRILCSSPRRPQVPSPIVSPVLEEMVRHHRSMRTHPLLLSSSSAGIVTNRLTCFGGDGPSSSIHAYTSSAPLLVVRRSRHQSSHLFWRRWSVIIDPCIHILCSSPRRCFRRSRHQSSHLFWRRWSVIIDLCIHILCSSLRRPQVSSPIVSPVLEEMVRHHRSMHTHPLLLSSSSAGLVTNRLTCFGGDGPSS